MSKTLNLWHNSQKYTAVITAPDIPVPLSPVGVGCRVFSSTGGTVPDSTIYGLYRGMIHHLEIQAGAIWEAGHPPARERPPGHPRPVPRGPVAAALRVLAAGGGGVQQRRGCRMAGVRLTPDLRRPLTRNILGGYHRGSPTRNATVRVQRCQRSPTHHGRRAPPLVGVRLPRTETFFFQAQSEGRGAATNFGRVAHIYVRIVCMSAWLDAITHGLFLGEGPPAPGAGVLRDAERPSRYRVRCTGLWGHIGLVFSVCLSLYITCIMVRRAWHGTAKYPPTPHGELRRRHHCARCALIANDVVRRHLSLMYSTMVARLDNVPVASLLDNTALRPNSHRRPASASAVYALPPSVSSIDLRRRGGAPPREASPAVGGLQQIVRRFVDGQEVCLLTETERGDILRTAEREVRRRVWFIHRDLLQLFLQCAFNTAYTTRWSVSRPVNGRPATEYKNILVDQYLLFLLAVRVD